jgi:hypothetical protein
MERLMSRNRWLPILGFAGLFAMISAASGQQTPYIGYVYPAGGQQGSTFQVKLGGQRLDGLHQVAVTGRGVTAKVVRFYRNMSNQELTLLREQLRELKPQSRSRKGNPKAKAPTRDPLEAKIIANIEDRVSEWCPRAACASISSLVWVEVTVAPDAEPGRRELRLVTASGVTNPLAFHIDQVPEVAREPMLISDMQVLGKEQLALRKRPPEDVEKTITLPCTVNGQIASGEVNWYRFSARRGQRLVFSVAARQLIPYIADAVPGWFQPVLTVYDADGDELAYSDDFRFKPDPTLMFEVPADGEYRFSITDAIYRGREDFVYRVTVGELPFVTSVFPLGGPVGVPPALEMDGWNLDGAKLTAPPTDAGPGVHTVAAICKGVVSNRVPFALDTLPECFEQEGNNAPAQAQAVELPVIVNGRIDVQDDWDVFRISGRAGQRVVAEVVARRLDSPLDSILKVCDATGRLLAVNDDHADVESGLNTHHADSFVMVELPADGDYFIHLGDTARSGGSAYAYRLRISPPQPDFALRVTPSSGGLRSNGSAAFSVYAIRKEGFAGPIQLGLKDPPQGFTAARATLAEDKEMARLGIKTTLRRTDQPVRLTIEGRATIDGREVTREAVPADDQMQAFLWRHLVPAEDLPVIIYNASYQTAAKRVPPPAPPKPKNAAKPAAPPQFTQRQVAGRLRQLKLLYEDWLLTDQFYHEKVAECEAVE